MTQMESKPASSAVRTMRASVSPMAASPPGHVNELIWRPIFMSCSLAMHALNAIVARVEAQGGSIELHSASRRGTTVTLTLPGPQA